MSLRSPEAGEYLVRATVVSTAALTAFDLRTYAVPNGGAPLTLTPAVIPGKQGVSTAHRVAWHLGCCEASVRLPVAVARGEHPGRNPLAQPGRNPGSTQAHYRVTTADQGAAPSVVVTATTGKLPTATATSATATATVTVKFSTATVLSLSRTVLFGWQHSTASVTVTSGALSLPAGRVVLTIGGRTVTEIAGAAGSSGVVPAKLPKKSAGVYVVWATFVPTADTAAGSTSAVKRGRLKAPPFLSFPRICARVRAVR